MINNNLILR